MRRRGRSGRPSKRDAPNRPARLVLVQLRSWRDERSHLPPRLRHFVTLALFVAFSDWGATQPSSLVLKCERIITTLPAAARPITLVESRATTRRRLFRESC